MTKKTIFLIISLSLAFSLNAKESNIKFNGSYESEFDITHKREYKGADYGEFSWGWNNYANLRFKADIGEYLTFGFAVNINMLAGNYTEMYQLYYAQMILSVNDPLAVSLESDNLFSIPFYYKSTYIGSFDLERLYFRVGNDYFDINTGLIRIARGYGYSFSPMDFFNPKDPLNLKARPEGKLAFVSTFYPADMWKIEAFVVAPDNPINSQGWGFKFGSATQFNVNKFNFEFLYTFFLPEIEYNKDPAELNLPEYINNDFSHIIGFSMKADIEIGLFIDAIYRLDHKVLWYGSYYGKPFYGYEGLEAAIGIDYTINIPGTYASIYLLLEYMFYGTGMIDWWDKDIDDIYAEKNPLGNKLDPWYETAPLERMPNLEKKPLYFARHDYIFGLINFKINNYVTISTGYLFGIDDQSSILSGSIEIEPFQAFTINISAMFPFAWEMINHTRSPGEFGSTNIGYYQNYKISVKMKF
ncbi:MAG: hypothetical protein KAT05_04550 [Spirochaetes bacterium]|nr:hypothetical protein [Spirochaetota bacterium]